MKYIISLRSTFIESAYRRDVQCVNMGYTEIHEELVQQYDHGRAEEAYTVNNTEIIRMGISTKNGLSIFQHGETRKGLLFLL